MNYKIAKKKITLRLKNIEKTRIFEKIITHYKNIEGKNLIPCVIDKNMIQSLIKSNMITKLFNLIRQEAKYGKQINLIKNASD